MSTAKQDPANPPPASAEKATTQAEERTQTQKPNDDQAKYNRTAALAAVGALGVASCCMLANYPITGLAVLASGAAPSVMGFCDACLRRKRERDQAVLKLLEEETKQASTNHR
jgi:hypothetical protein